MTDIKVGDRVKAVNLGNGDTAEFTVVKVHSDGARGYESELNTFATYQGWTFEKIVAPLPTDPGLYVADTIDSEVWQLQVFVLDEDGTWTIKNNPWAGSVEQDVEAVNEKHGLVRLVREDSK